MPDNTIDISEQSGVRYLHFSRDLIQGAMRLQRPNALELAYTREMMAGLLLRDPPWPRSALLIGLGAGSLAKFIYHNLPDTRMTVLEIDAQIEAVARTYFKLPDDPLRMNIIIGDGAEYALKPGPRFDYILVDGFDKEGRAGTLDTFPFYQACRARLSDQGLFVANLLGRSRGFTGSVNRLARAFDDRLLVFPSCDSGNRIAFATGGDPVDLPAGELIRRATELARRTGLKLVSTIPQLQSAGTLINDRLIL